MAWEENPRICLHMQLIAILSRTGVKIIQNSEQRALQLFLEDCRTFKIIKFNLLSKYYVPIDLDKLDSEKDLFRLEFKI